MPFRLSAQFQTCRYRRWPRFLLGKPRHAVHCTPWLDNDHAALDAAVAGAYRWPSDISEEDALAALLARNLPSRWSLGSAGSDRASIRGPQACTLLSLVSHLPI